MAIFHHSVQVIGRSSGKTSTGAAAYRSAEKIVDERTGIIHNYTKKLGVCQSEIITPHLPKVDKAWMMDRAQLWNKVEGKEKRYDAQLVREVNIAIPVELNRQDQIALVRDYVKSSYVDRGMIADVNWHNLESNNPHAHIMLTMRELVVDNDRAEFGNKNREWNDRDLAIVHRREWAEVANRYLENAGYEVRIDHRSLVEQGITDRIPQIHLGADVAAMRKKGIPTDRGEEYDRIAQVNIEIKAQLERIYQAEVDLQDEIAKPPPQPTRSQSQPSPTVKSPIASDPPPAWKEISTREEQEEHRQMLAKYDRRFRTQNQKSPQQEERERAARIEVRRLANRADNERVRLARAEREAIEARAEAALQKEIEAAQQQLESLPTTPEVEVPLEIVPETYMPTRLELVNWYRASQGDERHQIEALARQLKTAYMSQDFMQGQPEPKILPDKFQSATVSISLTDKQQFEQKLQTWQQQKRETPLGKFIEDVKKLATQDPTGQQTFETMKARRTLEEIAKEDPINRAGLKILNSRLISNLANRTADTENLNKLIVNLEHIRDNPEYYQNIERQREIERQNDNLRTNTRDRGGRGR